MPSVNVRKSSGRNFVKEGAQVKVNMQATKKQYVPGVYAQHHPSQCEHMLQNRPIHLKLEKATDGKEMVKIVTQENVRDLLVPSHNINVYPTIWQSNEMKRIKSAGKIITKEERRKHIDDREAEKKRLERESENRRQMLKEMNKAKMDKADAAKSVNKEEENLDAVILDRAFIAKQEQTEEVQRANRLILATKCHIIRDAQVQEKQEIEREFREENLRLEKMMMEEREKSLREEDERREKIKHLNAKHALEIKNQLKLREMAKLMEAERIEEEAKAMAKAQVAITMDMMEKEKNRKEQMIRIRSELEKSNELSEFFKSLAFEEQRIADMKAQEYMRKKQEEEKQLKLERKLAREQKQREADRLLALQTKLLGTKSEQEEMNMRRNQEEKEREFRRKEKEAAIRKKKIEKEVEEARLKQLEEMKRMRALHIVREEIDFQKAVSQLKQAEIREKEREKKLIEQKEKYRTDIINQMNEKEEARRNTKKTDTNLYKAELKKDQERNKNINSIINRKINAMKNANIPEKFIKDVERQLHVTNSFKKM